MGVLQILKKAGAEIPEKSIDTSETITNSSPGYGIIYAIIIIAGRTKKDAYKEEGIL